MKPSEGVKQDSAEEEDVQRDESGGFQAGKKMLVGCLALQEGAQLPERQESQEAVAVLP